MTQEEKFKPTTWHDLQWKRGIQPQQAPSQEPASWLVEHDFQQMRQRDPKRYKQEVWLKFRREVDPNATLADLPEELK